MTAANIQAIRDALAALASAIPESERNHDAAANIVLSLMAGLITPAAAMEKIRLLLEVHTSLEVSAHA